MSKLIAQTLPEADKLTVDPMHYYRQVLHGYYNFNCYVSEGVTRTAKFYIPEGSVYNQPTIFLAVPAARPTDEFLVDSGWKDLADQMGFYIILMEAENGAWGDDAKEIPYITALNEDVNFRPFFCAFSSKFYVYAYGETAGMVGRQSRLFPKCWAGVALLGPSGMTADELHELQTKETRVPGVKYSDVQMPVWLSAPVQDDDFNRQLAYYQAANHSVDTPEEVDGKTAFDGLRAGDKTAEKVVNAYIGYLAEGLANLANIFRPEAIVLGGGVCAEGETLLAPLRRKMNRLVYAGTKYAPVLLLTASLGNDAGLVGAARFAQQH